MLCGILLILLNYIFFTKILEFNFFYICTVNTKRTKHL